MADQDTIKLTGDRGVWLSLQPFEAGDNPLSPAQMSKASRRATGIGSLAGPRRPGREWRSGPIFFFSPKGPKNQPVLLTRFARVFGNIGTLQLATSGNCELFALSGQRNTYKEAKLGVLQRGAWADMLLVDGDPTQNLDLLKDYERNLFVILKGGKVRKNRLSGSANAQ